MINRQKGTNKISQSSFVITLIPFMKVEPPKALLLYTNTMSVRDQPRNFVRTYTHRLAHSRRNFVDVKDLDNRNNTLD